MLSRLFTALLIIPAFAILSCNIKGFEDSPYPTPRVVVDTPAGTQQEDVTLTYRLIEVDGSSSDISLQYSTDGGATWNSATAKNGDGTANLQGGWLPGIQHTIVWDSSADGVTGSQTARIKITGTKRSNGTEGTPGTTNDFLLQNPDIIFISWVSKPEGTVRQVPLTFTWKLDTPGQTIASYYYGLDEDPPTNATMNTSVTIPAPSLGAHTFRVYASAVSGLNSSDLTATFTCDNAAANVPPTVVFTSVPTGVLFGNDASFSWQGYDVDGSVSYYQYDIDCAGWVNCGLAVSHTLSSLSCGWHDFSVMCVDNDGAPSLPETHSFQVKGSNFIPEIIGIDYRTLPTNRITRFQVRINDPDDTYWTYRFWYDSPANTKEEGDGNTYYWCASDYLDYGDHTFFVEVEDEWGGVSAIGCRSFTVIPAAFEYVGPFQTGTINANKLVVKGNCLYAGNPAGLGIYDISNPLAPSQVNDFGIAGSFAGILNDTAVFMAVDTDPYCAGLDLTDPYYPVLTTRQYYRDGRAHIFSSDQYMYLLVSTSWLNFRGFDVYSSPSPGTVTLECESITSGPFPYPIKYAHGGGGKLFITEHEAGVYTYDITNPIAPKLEGKYVFYPLGRYPAGVQSVNGMIHLVDGRDNFYVLDPANASELTPLAHVALPESCTPLITIGDYAYTANTDLYTIRWNPFAGASIVSTLANQFDIVSFAYKGNALYAAIKNGTIEVYDISSPGNPAHVYSTTAKVFTGIFPEGNRLHLMINGQMEYYDITDLSSPVYLGSISVDGSPGTFARYGDYIFASGGNVSVIHNPPGSLTYEHVRTVDGLGSAGDCVIMGTYLLVHDYNLLKIYSLTDPSNPILEYSHNINNTCYAISVSGTRAFFTGSQMTCWDLADPANPIKSSIYGNIAGRGAIDGNYVLFPSSSSITVSDWTDLSNRVDIAGCGITFAGSVITRKDGNGFWVLSSTNLSYVDVTDITKPLPIQNHACLVKAYFRNLIIDGEYIYVLGNSNLLIFRKA
ncbi:MAG: hypothetical protein E3J72_21970 [Planctomycetota bacterium]|nr:MAG: hypothetical protein E3J72_21970 [Planctomycetota bacterium]